MSPLHNMIDKYIEEHLFYCTDVDLISIILQVRLVSLAGPQFDYCVFQCFSTSMSTTDIYSVINDTLLGVSLFQFTVVSVIGDGAQCNRQFQKRYFTETVYDNHRNKYDHLMIERINNRPIFYISDPSHMVKKIVSSLSSGNRNIFKSIHGEERHLSLSSMLQLWLSFNDSSGLNEHPDFKTIDFVKNSFQAMRVGPCIKVIIKLNNDTFVYFYNNKVLLFFTIMFILINIIFA